MEWQEALEKKGIKDRGGVTEKKGGMAGSIRTRTRTRTRSLLLTPIQIKFN